MCINKTSKIQNTNNVTGQARTQGGALGARAPPTWKNVPVRNVQKRRESSAQICEQKRMCTFRSDTTKLKRKRLGKKKT